MKKGQIELLAPAGEPEIAKAALRAVQTPVILVANGVQGHLLKILEKRK